MPRILWNMAQDGLVFNWCAKVSKKSKTPLNATIIATILAAFLAGIFRLDILVDVMSIGTLAAYALVALCVLILRYRPDDVDLVNKAGPNEKQGEQSTKLIYYISGWYLLAGIVMNKIELWIPDNLGLADNIFKVCAISMVVFSIYVIYVLNKIPQSTKDLAFKVPFLPYFPLLNLAINLYLMAALTLEVWIQLLVWLSLGFAIYFFYGVEHSIESPEQQRFLGSNSEDEGYRNKEKEANQQV